MVADAQLDEPQRRHLSIGFDITDLPGEQLIFPWRAWRMCGSGAADPALFGHGPDAGAWFVQVNLARDLLSLCKREVSAWDTWRDARERHRILDDGAALQCDRIAALAEAANGLRPPGLEGTTGQGFPPSPPWQRR